MLFAIKFTEFHPRLRGGKFSQSIGEPTDPPESPVRLIDWLPPFVVVTGIVGWVSDDVPDAVGIALIVAVSMGSAW
jgi:hypothetical protein